MDNRQRMTMIRQALEAQFLPCHLQIDDDSHWHKGHGGHGGAGHFSVSLVSAAFEGKTKIERHQAVYAALSAMMGADIHALSIKARTPAEVRDGS